MKKYFSEIDAPAIIYGPFEAPVYKAQGKYRKRIIAKCKLTKGVLEAFGKILCSGSGNDKTTLSIDFNPSTL
jgi:primosomal protein N'